MASNNVSLGELIHQVGERNRELLSTEPLGVSIDKEFMPSVANTIGTDLSKYMLLRRNRFACNPMHVGRDRALPIARYKKDLPGIVSPAYMTFEANENKVDLDYLELFFKLAVFDKECWFYTDSSVRGGLSWDALCSIELNLPSLNEQHKIASIAKVIRDRTAQLAEQNDYLAELAQLLFNDWFRDFGHWGGVMPSHWESGVLGDYITVKRGGSPRPIQEYLSDQGLRWLKIADVSGVEGPYVLEIKERIKEEGLRKTVHLEPGSLVLSNSATPGIPKIISIDTCIHDGWLYFPESQFSNEWLYCYFVNVRRELARMANGSVFQNLKTDIVKNFEVIRPDDECLDEFQSLIEPVFRAMEACQIESKQLGELKDALLPKLMSGEVDVSKVNV